MLKPCGSCRAVIVLYRGSRELKEYHCQNMKKWGQKLDATTKLDTDGAGLPVQKCSDRTGAIKELKAKNFVTFDNRPEDEDECR